MGRLCVQNLVNQPDQNRKSILDEEFNEKKKKKIGNVTAESLMETRRSKT